MSSRIKNWSIIGLLGLGAAIGTAAAQQAGGGGGGSSELNLQVDQAVASARETEQRVAAALAKATKEKDSLKKTCLEEKQTELKVKLNLFDAAVSEFRAAADASKQAAFANVGGTKSEVDAAGTAADLCVGEVNLKAPTGPEVDVPDIKDHPTEWDPNWGGVIYDPEQPNTVSPFK